MGTILLILGLGLVIILILVEDHKPMWVKWYPKMVNGFYGMAAALMLAGSVAVWF